MRKHGRYPRLLFLSGLVSEASNGSSLIELGASQGTGISIFGKDTCNSDWNFYGVRVVTGAWLHLPSFLCCNESVKLSGTKVSDIISSEA